GPLLAGVRFSDHTILTHSVVIRGQSGTVRYISTQFFIRCQGFVQSHARANFRCLVVGRKF
ncbi:MAG: fructose-bisphosphatase class II, partial [Patescibacteria group bacterium]|nr:fructose-bisphosphatase class II [Patescibacteria group bacterium]